MDKFYLKVMYNRIFLFTVMCCLFSLFIACGNKQKDSHNATTLQFETITTKDSIGNCEDARCFHYDIKYLSTKVTQGVAKNIVDTLDKYMLSSIVGHLENAQPKKLEEALKMVRQDYDSQMAEDAKLPEADRGMVVYDMEIEDSILYQNDKVISIAQTVYAFTGGAHPNGHEAIFTFDKKTGKTIEIKSLVKDEKAFIAILEKYLRISRELPKDKTLLELGFLFEGEMDTLPLPVDYSVTNKGIYVVYNPYEIAAYAYGSSAFEIPFSELEQVLNLMPIR